MAGRDPLDSIMNVAELESIAEHGMDSAAWDYYASGADDEVTLRNNRAAFQRRQLHYRVLVDVSERDTATTVLGQAVAMPVLVAPTAFHRLAHDDGELATARAASSADTVMILSTLSNTPVEQVVQASRGPVWFQLYVYRDRAQSEALVHRVEAAGCSALVLTVDAPVLGRRERDARNQFQLPRDFTMANVHADRLPPAPGESGLASYFATLLDSSLCWDDIAWLRSLTKLPIVIKGIVRADDAVRAVDAGAHAVVVSNHGGRQLDTAPATLDVIGSVADAVAGRGEIYLDGGVRRGTDVVKALALGARAVLIGRPILWGLAAYGQAGVEHVLGLLQSELSRAMALCGCPRLDQITRDLIDP